jgi:hypothetical protein
LFWSDPTPGCGTGEWSVEKKEIGIKAMKKKSSKKEIEDCIKGFKEFCRKMGFEEGSLTNPPQHPPNCRCEISKPYPFESITEEESIKNLFKQSIDHPEVWVPVLWKNGYWLTHLFIELEQSL